MEHRAKLTLFVYNRDRSCHLRGHTEIMLPFAPCVGMHIQYRDMYPLHLKKVIWSTERATFDCTVEDDYLYEFALDDDVSELLDILDVLRDAKRHGWLGLDKIYRDR